MRIAMRLAVVLGVLLARAPLLQAQFAGTAAPDFELVKVTPGTIIPFQFFAREKRPYTVLSYWAIWCKPCEKLHPWLEAFAREHAASVQVITINMRESPDSVRQWLSRDTVSATLDLLDRDGVTVGLYEVTSVPTTLLIDEHNMVVQRWEGIKAVETNLEPTVQQLLAGKH
jgi:thiol-disulfide isomerase/thioredoxin